jgi:hypothetical protein
MFIFLPKGELENNKKLEDFTTHTAKCMCGLEN